MKTDINNELDQLKKTVWALSRETLENIKATLEKLDVSALETLQSQVEILNALPGKVQTNIESISSLQSTKVDKEEGKQLSTNDYTTEEKLKLASLPSESSGGNVPENVVVDANYVHTDNNYTTDEKTKLEGIEEGANNYTLPDDVARTSQIKTKLSEMEDDNFHRVVSDSAIDYWTNKVDKASLALVATTGAYSDLIDAPITSLTLAGDILLITIPTSESSAESSTEE